MSAKWKWGTVDIYVSENEVSQEVKRAELFVLDSTSSVFQYFGAGSKHITLRGLVIGDTNRNSILSDAISDTAQSLTTPYGTVPSAKINGTPKFTAILYSGAFIDGVVYDPSVTPLYNFEMEIIV